MELSVNELCDRYGIKSKKTLYTRLDGLRAKDIDADLPKDGNKSYATKEQIIFLDQLDEHIKNGGTIKNFIPTAIAEVTVHDTTTQHSENQDISIVSLTTQHSAQLTTQEELLGDIVAAIATLGAATEGLADKLPPKNPLWYMAELERARASGWLLTTAEVEALIGVKPSCKKGKSVFKRGCFVFAKFGKIGSQTAWKVQKVTDDSYQV